MIQIHWNSLARQDYFSNIEYLLSEWSENEVQKFIDKVSKILSILEKGQIKFQQTNRDGI